ncbi:unnamed protein product, partial [marine sediment metagenome]
DGQTWQQAGSFVMDMPADVLVGIVVCSHVRGVLCEAVFDNVRLVE